jgi:thiopeptide-type bacteriocin biosynthesis protein
VLLLHAGESLRLGDGDVKIEHGSRQVWPYDSLEWQQVNVAPTLVDGSMVSSAGSVFRALEPFLNEWRNKRQLASFFFMRKDPGIRLRFLADHAVARELSELLDRLVDEGAVDAWFRSIYEPEVQRFGGGAAMEAVHKWFDADTTQWIRLDRLRTDGRAVIARDMLCAAVALDLVKATVPDRGESWAVWCQYASSSGLASEDVTADLPVPDFESLTSNATPGEQEVLHAYEAANRTLSDELLRVWRDGQLCAGLRSVLAAIILFHFNRHGLDAAAHARIAWTMIHALDPAGALVPRQTEV